MVIDEPLRVAIGLGKNASEINEIATTQCGMKTLRQDGIAKALQGVTTLEEVLAVTSK